VKLSTQMSLNANFYNSEISMVRLGSFAKWNSYNILITLIKINNVFCYHLSSRKSSNKIQKRFHINMSFKKKYRFSLYRFKNKKIKENFIFIISL
jgi:hypothetical protein